MITRIFWLMLAIGALCSAAIGVVHARSFNSSTIQGLLAAGENCEADEPTACWQGIRVGRTTRAEAIAVLNAHPWVSQVFQSSLAVSWRWNGQQPGMIAGNQDGVLRIEGGIVQQIRVQTIVPFGEVWLALGAPDAALLIRPVSRSSAYQIVDYEPERIHIVNTLGCPVEPEDFWQGTVTLGFGDIWFTETINGASFDIYQRAEWWRRLRRCRPG